MLERWITETPFREAAAPAQSDLDVAKGANAKDILERHWYTWITDTDWAWLAEKGINTVRIPVRRFSLFPTDVAMFAIGHRVGPLSFAESSPSDRLLSCVRCRPFGTPIYRLRGTRGNLRGSMEQDH